MLCNALLVWYYMPAWLPTAFCRLHVSDSLGQADAIMPLLLSSQMSTEDNGHSDINSSLSWWLYPTDNRSAISDK